MKRPSAPLATIISIRLDELPRVAAALARHGEIIPPGPWLAVICNCLAAAETRPTRTPRPYRSLSYSAITYHLGRCGVAADDDAIHRQIEEMRAWGESLARDGRPWRPLMSADHVGRVLGITDPVREEARAWNLGTYGGTPAARAKAKRERDKMKKQIARRTAGAMSRQEYEGKSLSRSKPWESEGISRRTWYARRNGQGHVCTSPALHKSGAPEHKPLHKSGAPELDKGPNASSGSPLEACGSNRRPVMAEKSIGLPGCEILRLADHDQRPRFPVIEAAIIIHAKPAPLRIIEAR